LSRRRRDRGYNIGTLYGNDRRHPFEGNRSSIVLWCRTADLKMDVWNDSAERILVQCGIEV